MSYWSQYHEFTKHSVESLRKTRHILDWANMPDPFRHYEGVPLLDLPADPPAPEIPTLQLLQGALGESSAGNGAVFLSQLLFHAAAISASKLVPSTGERYALRVNPSSGNLHPTEFHFFTRHLRDWPDGLYHYRPSSHMAEQRALVSFDAKVPIVFVLTSIAWREAWKYHDRAYRYCLLDIGHAWQALTLSAQAMGCESFAVGSFADDALAQECGLNGDEWPMLVMHLDGACIPLGGSEAVQPTWFGGHANRLSHRELSYASIEEIHSATKVVVAGPAVAGSKEIQLPWPVIAGRTFGETARMRRSALDFEGGSKSISLDQLSMIVRAATQPFSADFASGRFVRLYLYVHRVDGLPPGVYQQRPEHGELELIKSGDQRVAAAALSLRQDLAGNACVAFSLVADLDRAARAYGDRGYRYAHFEAGAMGHRLYLTAEAMGLAGTGIGAFFDDDVNRYLDLVRGEGQVAYHFAIGYPVPDPRLDA